MKLLCGAIACALCILACLSGLPSETSAQTVFEIADEARGWLCYLYEDPFDIYVWAYPDTAGLACARYQFILPENMTVLSMIVNPEHTTIDGTLVGPPGMTICFPACQRDLIWTVKYQCTFISTYCSSFDLVAHEGFSEIQISYFSGPDEYHKAWPVWDFGYPGPDCPCPANEETSWGAIKAMYK